MALIEKPDEVKYGTTCNSDIQYLGDIYYPDDTLECVYSILAYLDCSDLLDCDSDTQCADTAVTESQYVNCNDVFMCRYKKPYCLR